jgi:hypothetical protein
MVETPNQIILHQVMSKEAHSGGSGALDNDVREQHKMSKESSTCAHTGVEPKVR